MQKKIFLISILINAASYFNLYPQAVPNYLNLDWDTNDSIYKKQSEHDFLGIFKNHYIEFIKSNFSNDIFIYETYHIKNQIKKLDSENVIFPVPNQNYLNLVDVVEAKAKIVKPDTTIYYNSEELKKFLKVDKSEFIDDYNYYVITNIEENDIVEFIYSIKKNYDFYGEKIIQESYPITSSKFILINNNLISNIKIYNSNNSYAKDTLINEKKAKYIDFKDIGATNNEQYSTYIANRLKVSYQCYNENEEKNFNKRYWNAVIQYSKELFFPKAENQKAANLLEEIKKNNIIIPEDDISLANALDNYVKNNFVITEDEPQIDNIDSILTNKKSSNFNIIRVYTQLLKQANINYEIAISCNRFNMKFDPDFFNHRQLGEIIIYFPNSEKYLSPNRTEYRVSEAPYEFIGNYGVFIDKNLEYYFSEITPPSKNYSQIIKNIKVKIPKNLNKSKIDESRSYSGYWGLINRGYVFLSENEETDFLIDYFTINGLEDKKIKNYKIQNFDFIFNSNNTPLKINSSITTSNLIEKKDELIYIKIGKVIGTQSNLFKEEKRTNPIEINFANEYIYNIEVNIPTGYSIYDFSDLVKNIKYISVDGKIAARFNSNVKIVDTKMIIEISEFYDDLKYEKSRYNEFRDVINTAAEFYNSNLVLTK